MPPILNPQGLPLFTEQEFTKLAESKSAPEHVAVIKGCFAEVEIVKGADSVKGATPRYKFKISTAGVDRDRDVINIAGWQLDNYKKNPVVLFAHDYRSLPVGQSVVMAGKSSLDAEVEFASADVYPFAETVRRMVDARFLRTASVGFKPLKYMYNEERRGVDIEEAELLEWSIVPVPANPECLVQLSVVPKGIVDEFALGCEKILEAVKGKGQWVVGADLGAFDVRKALKDTPEFTELLQIVKGLSKKDAGPAGKPGCNREGGCPSNEHTDPMNCSMADCPMKGKSYADEDILAGIVYEDPDVLKLDDEKGSIDVTADQATIIVRDMIMRSIPAMVQEQVVKAINYARGRVD